MRFFLVTGLSLGLVLVFGAVFVAIDTAVTDDNRASFQAAVDAEASGYEEANGRARRGDVVGKLAHFYATMRDGIFKGSGLDLAAALPPAPPGWDRRPYELADGEAMTGAKLTGGPLVSTTEDRMLARFADATKPRRLAAAATYTDGATTILLRLTGSMEAIREAEAGDVRRARRTGARLATLDGVPVRAEPRFYTDLLRDRRVPVDYRRFTVDLDGMVEIELLTDAATPDVLAVLSGLDMAALQAALPVATAGYRAGAGAQSDATPEG